MASQSAATPIVRFAAHVLLATPFRKYLQALSVKYATIPDALSGRRLNVFDQCVPINMDTWSRGSQS